MPFTFPEDLTLSEYEFYQPARPHQGTDPLGQGGQTPPPGLEEEDDSVAGTARAKISP